MKRILLAMAALAAIVVIALAAMAVADYYDPAPVETPTKTCEPIGAQHPKADSKECKQ